MGGARGINISMPCLMLKGLCLPQLVQLTPTIIEGFPALILLITKLLSVNNSLSYKVLWKTETPTPFFWAKGIEGKRSMKSRRLFILFLI
jgi:hypothetical protein